MSYSVNDPDENKRFHFLLRIAIGILVFFVIGGIAAGIGGEVKIKNAVASGEMTGVKGIFFVYDKEWKLVHYHEGSYSHQFDLGGCKYYEVEGKEYSVMIYLEDRVIYVKVNSVYFTPDLKKKVIERFMSYDRREEKL